MRALRMRSRSIRSFLAVFAIAILTPTLVLAGFLVWRFADQERVRGESELQQLTRNVLLAVDRDFVGVESALQALSTSRALKRGDYASFYAQANEAKAFNNTNVVVRDLEGQQVVNTRVPFGAPLPRANRDADDAAARARAPVVSDLIVGTVAREPLFLINAPVFNEGGQEIIAFVNMSLAPDRVRDVIAQANIPPGWSVGVLDRNAVIVGRLPDHEALVGRTASQHFRDNTPGLQGWYRGINLQDVSVVTAYARSPRFGWIVTASAPRALLEAPLRRSLYALGLLTAALLALSAALAIWFGRRIALPVQSLASRAAALGRGETVGAAPLGLGEIDMVGQELSRSSVSLAQERRSLETLNAIGRDLAGELDQQRLVQYVIDAATNLSGAAYGAFFERISSFEADPDRPMDAWRLFALSGAPIEAFTRFGFPRATNLFKPTFGDEGAVRSDDVEADPRYGSHGGMPKGHLPVRSYLAVPVRSRSGGMIGALLFGHPEPGRFGDREERLVSGLAGQAATAIDNARLFEAAQVELAQRRTAEQALAAAKSDAERLAALREAILGQLAEGVIVTDADGRITFVNAAASRLHGVARLEVEPENYAETYQLFTLDGRPHPFEDLPLAQAVMKAEFVRDARWRIRRPDGSEVLAIGSAGPVTSPDGTRLGSVLTLRDDTEREAAERELLRLNDTLSEYASELKESNEELQRYAYIVSHDLRAPLVNVMGFTNELRTLKPDLLAVGARPQGDVARAAVEKEFDESIGFIDAAVDKMEALIAAILKLSREGRRTFRPEPLAMGPLLQGLADSQRHQADTAGATIVIASDIPDLVADRLAIEQVFANLIDNAVKYLDPARPGHIQIEGETIAPGRLRYRVRDNGRGMAPADHGRVFELFRRAGKQDKPGEGIGLAHVKALVRALGGRIGVASTFGEGATFTIVLPALPPAGQQNDRSDDA